MADVIGEAQPVAVSPRNRRARAAARAGLAFVGDVLFVNLDSVISLAVIWFALEAQSPVRHGDTGWVAAFSLGAGALAYAFMNLRIRGRDSVNDVFENLADRIAIWGQGLSQAQVETGRHLYRHALYVAANEILRSHHPEWPAEDIHDEANQVVTAGQLFGLCDAMAADLTRV